MAPRRIWCAWPLRCSTRPPAAWFTPPARRRGTRSARRSGHGVSRPSPKCCTGPSRRSSRNARARLLDTGGIAFALFLSAGAARAFAELLREDRAKQWCGRITAVCLSDRVVEAAAALPLASNPPRGAAGSAFPAGGDPDGARRATGTRPDEGLTWPTPTTANFRLATCRIRTTTNPSPGAPAPRRRERAGGVGRSGRERRPSRSWWPSRSAGRRSRRSCRARSPRCSKDADPSPDPELASFGARIEALEAAVARLDGRVARRRGDGAGGPAAIGRGAAGYPHRGAGNPPRARPARAG